MAAKIISLAEHYEKRQRQQQDDARRLDATRRIRDTAANEFAALFLAIEAAGRAPTEAENRRLDILADIVNRFDQASARAGA